VAITKDIAEGYVIVNPIFLKPLDIETLKGLRQQIAKLQTEIRGEKFPFKNTKAIRSRNMRLQRLHSALMIMNNYVKEKGMKHLFS
jgi:hypothetical protein